MDKSRTHNSGQENPRPYQFKNRENTLLRFTYATLGGILGFVAAVAALGAVIYLLGELFGGHHNRAYRGGAGLLGFLFAGIVGGSRLGKEVCRFGVTNIWRFLVRVLSKDHLWLYLLSAFLLMTAIIEPEWIRENFGRGSFFTLLRLVVTVAAVVDVIRLNRMGNGGLAIFFGHLAILFNPIVPLHLEKGAWKIIDFFVATYFYITFFAQVRKAWWEEIALFRTAFSEAEDLRERLCEERDRRERADPFLSRFDSVASKKYEKPSPLFQTWIQRHVFKVGTGAVCILIIAVLISLKESRSGQVHFGLAQAPQVKQVVANEEMVTAEPARLASNSDSADDLTPEEAEGGLKGQVNHVVDDIESALSWAVASAKERGVCNSRREILEAIEEIKGRGEQEIDAALWVEFSEAINRLKSCPRIARR